MRWLALTLSVLIAAGTAGCDYVCVYDSCGCGSSSSGVSYATTGGDPAHQSLSVGVGEAYTYDLRDFVYVYRAYGRDCVADRSVRYPFRTTDIQIEDNAVVSASASSGVLELIDVSSGVTQLHISLEATGLTDTGDVQELRRLTLDVVVSPS